MELKSIYMVIGSKYPFFTDEAKREEGTCLKGYRVCSRTGSSPHP